MPRVREFRSRAAEDPIPIAQVLFARLEQDRDRLSAVDPFRTVPCVDRQLESRGDLDVGPLQKNLAGTSLGIEGTKAEKVSIGVRCLRKGLQGICLVRANGSIAQRVDLGIELLEPVAGL